MRNRILSIVLALSLIAVLFAALPTRAAMPYTGAVTTTDNAGVAKTNFIRGDAVYVNVEVMFNGVLSNQQITVTLARTNDGHVASSFTTNANDPVNGWYNSSQAAGHLTLSTAHSISGDVQSYDVIVTLPGHGGVKIAETQILVRNTGLTLQPSPNNPAYWPGETVTATLVITQVQTTLVFYVQIVNDTGAQTTFNMTGQSTATGYWTTTFTISSSLPDGTYSMNVRQASDNSFWYSVSFDVQAFEFLVMSQRDAYMPGETAKVTYLVLDLATLARVTSGVVITANISYVNSTGDTIWVLNTTLPIDQNLWLYTVPANIPLYTNVDIVFKAKQGEHSVEEDQTILIGTLDATVDTDQSSYMPGDAVVVDVHASVLGDDLDGANVTISVFRNGTEELPTYAGSGLLTDINGDVTHAFLLSGSSTEGNYIVKAVVTKVGFSVTRETQFSVNIDGFINVAFDKSYYFGGQSATVSFDVVWNNAPASVGSVGYFIMTNNAVLAASNTTGRSVTVTIPADFFGTLSAAVFAHVNEETLEGFNSVDVVFAEVGLTTMNDEYRPGDTITFAWTIVTGQLSGSLMWEIMDDNGVRVATGTPAFAKSGTFQYTVPAASPLLSQSFDANLVMTTPSGGFASASTSIDIVAWHELMISVEKSPYTSGEYAPGQTIKIDYDIGSYVQGDRPSYRLHVQVENDPIGFDVITSSPSGTISYTIPKDAPAAPHDVTVWAYDAVTGDFLSADSSAFTVNNRLSGWDRSVGGLSAGDMIILILVIIVIIMLIVVPYLRDRMAAPKTPEKYEAPEPAEPGKTPPSP